MAVKQPGSSYHQHGAIVLVPLLLLLGTITLFTQSSAARYIRLQQTHTALNATLQANATAHVRLRQLLGILRITPQGELSDALHDADAEVTAFPQRTPKGTDVIFYAVRFRQPVAPLAASLHFHFEALRYPALAQLPDSTFWSSALLPAGTRLILWDQAAAPRILANSAPALPLSHLQHCQPTEVPLCNALTASPHTDSADAILRRLFNRTRATLRPDTFVGATAVSRCDTLGPQVAGVVWITGDCRLAAMQRLGTSEAPVLLIVEDGDLVLGVQAEITGMVLMLHRHSLLPVAISMAPESRVNGAMVNTAALSTDAQIHIAAAPAVLARLQNSAAMAKVVLIPGSWRDFD